MVFPKNSGDPEHPGLSVGLSRKKVELTLDANSSSGKASRSPRSSSGGPSNPTTNFIAVKINQFN